MTKRDEAAYLICAVTSFVIMMTGWLVTGVPIPWWEPALMLEIPTYFLFKSFGFSYD